MGERPSRCTVWTGRISRTTLPAPVELVGFSRPAKLKDIGCSRRLSMLLSPSPGHRGALSASVTTVIATPQDLSVSAPRLGDHAAQPGVGDGHHLHSDGPRLHLSGSWFGGTAGFWHGGCRSRCVSCSRRSKTAWLITLSPRVWLPGAHRVLIQIHRSRKRWCFGHGAEGRRVRTHSCEGCRTRPQHPRANRIAGHLWVASNQCLDRHGHSCRSNRRALSPI